MTLSNRTRLTAATLSLSLLAVADLAHAAPQTFAKPIELPLLKPIELPLLKPMELPLLKPADLPLLDKPADLPLLDLPALLKPADLPLLDKPVDLPLLDQPIDTSAAAAFARLLDTFLSPAGTILGCPTELPLLDDTTEAPQNVGAQAALSVVNAGAAAMFASGDGVVVAIIDGGFDLSHDMLDGYIVDEYDAIDQDYDAEDLGNGVDDDNSGDADDLVHHGSAIASLIVTMAPDVSIMPIRALDDEGVGTNAALERAIDHAVANGADIINLSMVATDLSQGVKDAIDDAIDAGIVIITAAGNDPTGDTNDAHLASNSITVGALDTLGGVASFSYNGSEVDIYAPGQDVTVALGGTDSWGRWSGTSFSCAFVAAGAAMMIENNPTLSESSVRDELADATSTVPGETAGKVNLALCATY